MKDAIVGQGTAAAKKGFINSLAEAQQRKLLEAFLEFSRSGGSVLEVGLAPVAGTTMPTRLTAGQPDHAGITVHGIRPAREAAGSPEMGESPDLPFGDGQFDWACSSGLIEHLAPVDQQIGLVREMARVARKGIFISTPNRRHPINFSTTSRTRLLRAQDLYGFAASLPGKPEHDVGHKRVFGIKAHFFLMVMKGKGA